MKKFIVIFFFLLMLPGRFLAQSNYIERLRNEVKSSNNDTLRLVFCSLLTQNYPGSNYDSKLFYSEILLQLARKLNYKLDEAYALDNVGYNMYYLSNPKSLQTLLEGLNIAENPASEKYVLPEKYWAMALYYDTSALAKNKKTPVNVRMQILASLYQDIGHVYGNDFGNRQKQLYYYFKGFSKDVLFLLQ